MMAVKEAEEMKQESPKLIPGLLNFRKLTINKGQISLVEEKLIERTKADQEYILGRNIHSVQFSHAARNVLGLLHYHSYRKGEALKLWKETVDQDPYNLNALQDLAIAYQKLRNNEEAVSYQKRLKQAVDASTDERKLRIARCQIEQAYALFWDLHTQSWNSVELRKQQVKFYEDGFMAAGELIDREDCVAEKRDWLLYTGQAHERLCHAYFRAGNQEGYLTSIGKAIEHLHETLDMSEHCSMYQAEVWYNIGNAFARNKRQSELEIPRKEMEKYKEEWQDPSLCYKKALELDCDNIWILGRLGVYWFKQQEKTKAMEMLDKSIEVADTLESDNVIGTTCWNALCHRAKLKIQRAADRRLTHEEKLQILQEAREDSSRAVKYNFNPITLAVDGEVHDLLTKNPKTEVGSKEQLRNVALERFYEASICQDGRSICNTHFKWARCLKDKGDLPSAIECYKIAFDTAVDPSGSFRACVASELLGSMLQAYGNKGKQQNFLKEMAFWFSYVYNKCQPTNFQFERLLWSYAAEVLDGMEYLIQKKFNLSSDVPSHMIRPALEAFTEKLKDAKFVTKLKDLKCDGFEVKLKKLIDLNEKNIECPQETTKKHDSSLQTNIPAVTPLVKGLKYDFFIINDENDPKTIGWVEHLLLKELESTFFGLKGYYHERNKVSGSLELKTRSENMENSANILIVLSHGLDKSIKDNMLVEMSHCLKEKEVIILQKEHVEVPISLRVRRKFDFTVQPNIPELARYLMPRTSLEIPVENLFPGIELPLCSPSWKTTLSEP